MLKVRLEPLILTHTKNYTYLLLNKKKIYYPYILLLLISIDNIISILIDKSII